MSINRVNSIYLFIVSFLTPFQLLTPCLHRMRCGKVPTSNPLKSKKSLKRHNVNKTLEHNYLFSYHWKGPYWAHKVPCGPSHLAPPYQADNLNLGSESFVWKMLGPHHQQRDPANWHCFCATQILKVSSSNVILNTQDGAGELLRHQVRLTKFQSYNTIKLF